MNASLINRFQGYDRLALVLQIEIGIRKRAFHKRIFKRGNLEARLERSMVSLNAAYPRMAFSKEPNVTADDQI